jgi:hypothetical protein
VPRHGSKWEPNIPLASARERFPLAFELFAQQLPDYQASEAFLDFAVTRGGLLRVRMSFRSAGGWAWASTARWDPKMGIWLTFSDGVKGKPYKEPNLEVSVRVVPALDKPE